MRALITGGSGQVGTALRMLLPDAVAPSHAELDLADTAHIRDRVLGYQPDCIFNCAAYTAVDAAEGDREAALLVNGDAVGELVAAAAELGVPLVTFSSDYVFDGCSDSPYTETSRPNPINAYGESKLRGEQLALRYDRSLVVRTSWLLSATHPNFVTSILDRASHGTVDVVDDQWGRPTMVGDLANAVLAVLDSGRMGLVHLASPPATTWFDLAREACTLVGQDPGRIVPISSRGLSRRARRPRRVVLDSDSASLPDWRESLAEWLSDWSSSSGADHPAAPASNER